MYASLETIESNLQDLVIYVFSVCRPHTELIAKQNVSHSSPLVEYGKEQEKLVMSTLDILHSIARKLDSTSMEKHYFMTQVIDQFDQDGWSPWEFIIQILVHILTKNDKDGNVTMLNETLNQIFISIYKKLNDDLQYLIDSQDNTRTRLGEEQLISICNVLAELYNLRAESHAFNHSNEMVYEVFRKL
jgi:hypothetical protein